MHDLDQRRPIPGTGAAVSAGRGPLRVYCAASLNELAVAAVVRGQMGPGDDVLLFDLNISGDAATVRAEVRALTEALDWPRVRFIEAGLGPSDFSADSRTRTAIRWVRRLIWFRSRVREQLAAEAISTGNQAGQGVEVVFNILHEYVIGVLGLLPRAKRVHYPHGFDQPRRQQVADWPYYYEARGTPTAVRTFRRQRILWRVVGPLLTAMYRLRRQGIVPLPFDGVDFSWTLSGVPSGAPYRRIPPATVRAGLLAAAGDGDIAGRIDRAFPAVDLGTDGLLLLSEANVNLANNAVGAAHRELLTRVGTRCPGVRRYWVKPHPRSSAEGYQELLEELRTASPEYELVPWPAEVGRMPVEILCARRRFAVACSLASCAMPPWAANSVPVFVSSAAGRVFDAGWSGKVRLSYELIAKVLHEEGLAEDLDGATFLPGV